MDKERDIIGSVDRALDILLLLQREGRELGVTQISSSLGVYKSTVYRTLATLENKGFVQQNPDNGKYWLGIRLYSLGMLINDKMPLKKLAYPYAKALSEKYREVVHISVLDKNAIKFPQHILIDKIESSQVLSYTPPVGSVAPCHCSGVGKCLLAYADRAYLDRFIGSKLPAYTDNTIVEWEQLLTELEAIKIRGYALDEEELEIGLTCVAAPILNRSKEIVAALSLSGPTSRVKSEKFTQIVADVIQATEDISMLMK